MVTWHSHYRTRSHARSLVLLGLAAAGMLCAAEDIPPTVGRLYVREYRVSGSKLLNAIVIGDTVYPFLGPGRTTDDIEQARVALEKAYHEKGFQAVSVTIPQQSGRRGIIRLEVVEAKVGELRVNGAKWFLPSEIRKRAPSLAPGTVPNFEDIQRDIVALNKSADLRVTPRLTANEDPSLIDIDLDVDDHAPLHGSFELNNRYSPNTVPVRLNGSLSYSNLWQLDHTLGFSFQIAPERLTDGEVYSAYYSVPLTGFDDTTLTFIGTKQSSDVSTLGGAAVVGRGQILGFRFNTLLPQGKASTHSLSFGMDYKHFDENLVLGGVSTLTPIDYYPFSLSYSGAWIGKKSFTNLNLGLNWHFRGMGSDLETFDSKRYNSDGSYIYLRGDVTHTHDLPAGFQVMTKVSGQLANNPLVNSEQLSGGGQSSVRGYLESSALGDNGVFGTLELRSPSFLGKHGKDATERDKGNEWRVYGFVEGGRLTLTQPLPQQQDIYDLASVGFGTHIKLSENFNGSLDAGVPLNTIGTSMSNDLFLSFRLWVDF
ncbi:MAG: ShlB/FhaC/HecB family hemolysin secretion/activation protein [Prosthecobacter sp.]|nr:ShlB/FhaC/HecB family hemolysin secretion/activation protein [Prosthecobacter sp.]